MSLQLQSMSQISTSRPIFTESLSYCVLKLRYMKWEKMIPVFPNFVNEENEERLK